MPRTWTFFCFTEGGRASLTEGQLPSSWSSSFSFAEGRRASLTEGQLPSSWSSSFSFAEGRHANLTEGWLPSSWSSTFSFAEGLCMCLLICGGFVQMLWHVCQPQGSQSFCESAAVQILPKASCRAAGLPASALLKGGMRILPKASCRAAGLPASALLKGGVRVLPRASCRAAGLPPSALLKGGMRILPRAGCRAAGPLPSASVKGVYVPSEFVVGLFESYGTSANHKEPMFSFSTCGCLGSKEWMDHFIGLFVGNQWNTELVIPQCCSLLGMARRVQLLGYWWTSYHAEDAFLYYAESYFFFHWQLLWNGNEESEVYNG